MNLLLAYLFLMLVWGMRSARRGVKVRAVSPLVVAAVVALGFLSRRII